MVSLTTVRNLALTIGPFFLPKAISYLRTIRAKAATSPVPVQSVPRPATYSLNILFVSAVLALISTLPHLNPENIFTLTSSRLQTPNDVLFNRLAAMRGTSGLTPDDETLRPKLASLDSRLLYLNYGPDVVTHCTFCMSDEPLSYLCYALPSMLLPHLLHLTALGLATSSVVGGKVTKKWRTLAMVIGVAIAFFDPYIFAMNDWKANARALRPEDYDLFYWKARLVRGAVLALCDMFFAGLVWLSSTNRAFVTPPTPAERFETSLRQLEQARGKVNALAVMRNAVVRDEGLRRRTEGYWIREGKIMGEIMDEREVVEGVRSALTGRIKVGEIEEEAKRFADGLIPMPLQPQVPLPAPAS